MACWVMTCETSPTCGLHRLRLFAHRDRFRDPGERQPHLHHRHAAHIKLHAVARLRGHAGAEALTS